MFRGDPATREFVAFWLVGDRVVAGMNVNLWDVIDPIKRLIGEWVTVDDRRLADPDGRSRNSHKSREARSPEPRPSRSRHAIIESLRPLMQRK